MKIIQNNKEYGYQQPIINNVDVLWDTDITASGQEHTLPSNLSSYARIIVTMTIPGIDAVSSNNATGSVDLSYTDFKAGKEASFYYGTANQRIRVKYVSDTKVRVDASVVPMHVKIEGVKRTAQVSNLDTWEDITSKCTFSSGFSASNTKVYANPLFIYIGHYGNNGASDNALVITLPVGYEAFGCLAGNQFRQQ